MMYGTDIIVCMIYMVGWSKYDVWYGYYWNM